MSRVFETNCREPENAKQGIQPYFGDTVRVGHFA